MQTGKHPLQITILLIFLSLLGTEAKSRAPLSTGSSRVTPEIPHDFSIRDFEQRMSPYLNQRIKNIRSGRKNLTAIPNESDIITIAAVWDKLSPTFLSLYQSATGVPEDFQHYVSPRGLFEIYYTTSGSDSVSAVDTMGYGEDRNWREVIQEPNGIPDYVDELAFALDSSWSMIVERFGFKEPIPLVNERFPSDRYKVVINSMPQDYYGLTFVQGRDPQSAQRGFMSYIEIRNDWSDPSWSSLGYDTNPENALRITAAHELFHAVQYSKVWEVDNFISLDNFPIGWTEGTAVLMEDLAFSYVKDYLQYANPYFLNPTIALLDHRLTSRTEYTNSLLTKFIAEKIDTSENVDFIRTMYTNNYNQKISFHQNLHSVSAHYNRTWACILNDFHTQSYFTGSRADSSRFISDAELMGTWNLHTGNNVIHQEFIQPYAMRYFSISPQHYHNDTLFLTLNGETGSQTDWSTNPPWAARAILSDNSGYHIKTLSFNDSAQAELTINSWKSYEKIIIVATNADSSQRRQFQVYFQKDTISYEKDEIVTLNAQKRGKSTAAVHMQASEQLRGAIDLNVNDSLEESVDGNTIAVSGIYQLSFPPVWKGNTIIDLSVTVPKKIFADLRIAAASSHLYFKGSSSSEWEIVDADRVSKTDSVMWRLPVTEPGYYTVLVQMQSPSATGKTVTVFPTTVKLSRPADRVRIQGEDIYQIRIFTMDGTLLVNHRYSESSPEVIRQTSENNFEWLLKNSSRRFVVPGLYYIIVDHKADLFAVSKQYRTRVVVLP